MKGITKVAPALATGAATALGEIELNEIFGKGITIPKKFITMLPMIKKEFTKLQRDEINKAYQTGGKLVIKPTRKQAEDGFLGTFVSIGIPMTISLVSKLFSVEGLQVDKQQSLSTRNVYVPPVQTHGQGNYYWENPIGMGVKKKDQRMRKGKGNITATKQPIQLNSSFRGNFVNKALSNFDLLDWVKKLGIKHFRDIYSTDKLPKKIEKNVELLISMIIKDLEHTGFVIEILIHLSNTLIHLD